jgi:hypothetical protein
MARQKKHSSRWVFVDGKWVTAEFAYRLVMGEHVYIQQTTPRVRYVDPGEQLPLVDVPEGRKPTAEELYARERAGT